MKLSTLIDVVCAAHLTSYVESPFSSRGGILVVAYGESLKTSILEILEYYHPAALIQTDLTVQALGKLRERIAQGQVRTLVLTDFQKIYERHAQVAANVEGSLRALTAEGFTSLSFQEQQINRPKARSLVMGAITPAFLEKHFNDWHSSGFSRRFIFPTYTLADPDALVDAVIQQKLIDFGRGVIPVPRNRSIPFDVSEEEGRWLHYVLRYQYGTTIPLELLQKIYSVLKWSHAENGADSQRATAMARETIDDFEPALSKEGTKVHLSITNEQRQALQQKTPTQRKTNGSENIYTGSAGSSRQARRR